MLFTTYFAKEKQSYSMKIKKPISAGNNEQNAFLVYGLECFN